MKMYFSEGPINYSDYSFNYCVYAEQEADDRLEDIYELGFLPYTGDSSLNKKLYYLCRSLRIDLDIFTLSSENKRILKKLDENEISVHKQSSQEMMQDGNFLNFVQSYSQARFSSGMMSLDRIEYIMRFFSHSFVYSFRKENSILGYVLMIEMPRAQHYWYSFYDIDQRANLPLGKWLMTKMIINAKIENKKHIYLGTCYGSRSLYKMRDYKACQYFDGMMWNSDMKNLKQKCKISDNGTQILTDELKLSNFANFK